MDDVVSKVNCGYVCVTGSEPLLQDICGLLEQIIYLTNNQENKCICILLE